MKMSNEQGSALLLTMIVIIVLLFLGGSLGLLAMVESNMVLREEHAVQAYYLARSGVDAVAQAIIDEPERLKDILGKTSKPKQFGQGEFTVQVVPDGDNITLVSTGKVQGRERVVTLAVLQDYVGPQFQEAIFATGKGTLSNPAIKLQGATIIGKVGSNTLEAGSIYLNQSEISDDLFVNPDADSEVLRLTQSTRPNTVPLPGNDVVPPSVKFPNFPVIDLDWEGNNYSTPEDKDYLINEDGRYNRIDITNGGRTVIIDLQNKTRIIRVKDINIQADVKLINPGRLLLYVDKSITMGGGRSINYNKGQDNNPEALTIYYNGSDTFGTGEWKLSGNVVVRDADVMFGGSSEFVGNIFSPSSKPINVLGGNGRFEGLIYAPNAPVSFLAGRHMTGAIIGSRVVVDWNSIITFDNINASASFPDDIFGGTSGDGAGSSAFSRGRWSDAK